MAALRELDLQRRQPLPTWQWAVPFVAATVLFFLGNAVSIARKAAMLWIVGAYFVFSVLVSATETSAPALHRGLSTVIGGRFGLETLLSGNVGRLVHTLQLSGGPAPVHALQPDLAAWLGSVALWLLIALIANAFALRSDYRFRQAAAGA